jgi:DNA-binding MarR family transcriptional regulator
MQIKSTPPRDVVVAATRAFVGVAAQALLAVGDDVSLPQYRVLVLLDDLQPQTMGALAERLGVNPSTATRICDRLTDKRLITRRVDETDRRSVRVQLTTRGQRLVDGVTRERRVRIETILERMGTAGAQRLATSLSEFAAAAGEAPDHAWTLGWSTGSDDRATESHVVSRVGARARGR